MSDVTLSEQAPSLPEEDKHCYSCAWSIFVGEDEVCIAEVIICPSQGSNYCSKYYCVHSPDKQLIAAHREAYYQSKHRKGIIERHMESLVGPLDKLGND